MSKVIPYKEEENFENYCENLNHKPRPLVHDGHFNSVGITTLQNVMVLSVEHTCACTNYLQENWFTGNIIRYYYQH